MKFYLVQDNADPQKLAKIGLSGQAPPAGAVEAPEDEDAAWLEVVEVEGEFGGTRKEAQINQAIKDSVLAQRAADAASAKWDKLRSDRDQKLKESDWTQMADSPLDSPTKASWASHRQDLRDLPSNTADIDNIVWPVEP